MSRLTKRQAAIICAHTGVLAGPVWDVYEYIDEVRERRGFGRHAGHHAGYPDLPSAAEIRELSRGDFLDIMHKEQS